MYAGREDFWQAPPESYILPGFLMDCKVEFTSPNVALQVYGS